MMTAFVPLGSSSEDRALDFLVNPFSLTKRPDMGKLRGRMAQDLVLRNFSRATCWRALREVVILCG
jgi:hypothetical protein